MGLEPIMKYSVIEDSRIVRIDLKAQWLRRLGPKTFNRKNCWDKSNI